MKQSPDNLLGRQQVCDTDNEVYRPQLHPDSLMIFELPLSLRQLPELLGAQKPKPELPVCEKQLAEFNSEVAALEMPAIEPVGSEMPAGVW